MGCYGIGITRTVAAAIEQHHDDAGIVWPAPLAPYGALVVPLAPPTRSCARPVRTAGRRAGDQRVSTRSSTTATSGRGSSSRTPT